MTHPDTLQIPRAVVEPAYLMSPDGKCYAPSKPPLSAGNAEGTLLTLYTATAIAAARVAALEEVVALCDPDALGLEQGDDCATGVYRVEKAIRALIGKESK